MKNCSQPFQKKISILVVFLLCCLNLYAQKPPFYDDIQAFKKLDSNAYPAKNAILFVGSSSFTKWTDVVKYFPGYPIINRGFGGSSLTDLIRYAPQIIFPYNPKQILIYCGENDLAGSNTVTSKIVYDRFVQLYRMIRNRFSKASIAFVSMKPSPDRQHLRSKMQAGNKLIQQFLARQKNTSFINIYPAMLLPNGRPMSHIFLSDSLHMNAKGYAIWQKIIKPYLLK